MKRLLILFALFLVPAMACNLPLSASSTSTDQKTLEAALFATATPAAPFPGAAQPPVPTPILAQAHAPALPTATAPTGTDALLFLEALPAALEYLTQPGDTAASVALRFGVTPETLQQPGGFLAPGTRLQLTVTPGSTLLSAPLLPDSEVIDGPSAADFSIEDEIQAANGFLSTYQETVDGETMTGAQSVRRAALETSISPRLLLAILDYRSGWVRGQPRDPAHLDYPIGFEVPQYRGVYKELLLCARELSIGYYGQRGGTLGTLGFPQGELERISPRVNSGTAALQVLFSTLYNPADWAQALYGAGGFPDFYRQMMGDPWQRAAKVEPQIPTDLAASQPVLELPFAAGEVWAFTGGPHLDWDTGSPVGALDFAPTGEVKGCNTASHWATAAAAGVVARSERGVLVLDLDGDGHEQTGWDLLYLHLADAGRLPVGTRVQAGDRLGHPSCEGGVATGKHVHIARKYNGEWLGINPATPFILGGWLAEAGNQLYAGQLLRDGQVVTAQPNGSAPSHIQW